MVIDPEEFVQSLAPGIRARVEALQVRTSTRSHQTVLTTTLTLLHALSGQHVQSCQHAADGCMRDTGRPAGSQQHMPWPPGCWWRRGAASPYAMHALSSMPMCPTYPLKWHPLPQTNPHALPLPATCTPAVPPAPPPPPPPAVPPPRACKASMMSSKRSSGRRSRSWRRSTPSCTVRRTQQRTATGTQHAQQHTAGTATTQQQQLAAGTATHSSKSTQQAQQHRHSKTQQPHANRHSRGPWGGWAGWRPEEKRILGSSNHPHCSTCDIPPHTCVM